MDSRVGQLVLPFAAHSAAERVLQNRVKRGPKSPKESPGDNLNVNSGILGQLWHTKKATLAPLSYFVQYQNENAGQSSR